ncbi:helix-turn-helix transcriptional regulator [Streptomyces mirabilis]|uniref:helix-turn-helix transcriptional regulator n=1 Tax=Streptomyces mirabilis TaxID=68239 RepID=UPI00381A8B4C
MANEQPRMRLRGHRGMRTPRRTGHLGPAGCVRISHRYAPESSVPRSFSGPRLRDQRRLAGLSVHDLAACVGRSCWTIYLYERGEAQPPIPVADALADALGLPLERFLADDRPRAVAA